MLTKKIVKLSPDCSVLSIFDKKKTLVIKTLQLFFVLFIVFTSCNDIKVKPEEKIYFSISPFIDSLVVDLEQNKTGLKKTAYLNKSKDSSTTQKVDWGKELEIFKEAEINKSSYRGKFIVDSTLSNDQKIITYSTDDKKIRAKYLKVTSENGNISNIVIKLKTDNALYSSTQNLELTPNKGFSVEGMQNIAQLYVDSFKLIGVFVD